MDPDKQPDGRSALGGINSPALRAAARRCGLDILEAYRLLCQADANEKEFSKWS